MMLLRIIIRAGTAEMHLVGRFNVKNKNEFRELLQEPWLSITDAVTTVTTQSINRNTKGEIQLASGHWATEQEIQANGLKPEDLMLISQSRMVAASTSEIDYRTEDIRSFRELSTRESEDYTKALQQAQLASSGLVTAEMAPGALSLVK